MHSGTGSRLTVPSSGSGNAFKGTWVVSTRIEFAANETGLRQLRLLKNGTVLGYDNRLSVGASVPTRCTMTVQVDLVEGDFVEVQVYQDSTGSLNTGSGADRVWFSQMADSLHRPTPPG